MVNIVIMKLMVFPHILSETQHTITTRHTVCGLEVMVAVVMVAVVMVMVMVMMVVVMLVVIVLVATAVSTHPVVGWQCQATHQQLPVQFVSVTVHHQLSVTVCWCHYSPANKYPVIMQWASRFLGLLAV